MRELMKRLILCLASLLIPLVSNAQYVSGQEFRKMMRAVEQLNSPSISREAGDEILRLIGFLQGVNDARRGEYFCIPSNVSLEQQIAVIQKHITENPDDWHRQSGVQTVSIALALAFPCKK